MTPALRRALHQCVDILCDALAEEAAEPKKRRRVSQPKPLAVPALSPDRLAELEAQVERQRTRAGYKKAG